MAIPTTGNISIKEAAGSTRSIDTAVTSTSSGSLVALGQNSINYTGGRSSGTNDTDASPYSMLEYSGYAHTLTQSVSENQIGRFHSTLPLTRIYGVDNFGQYQSIIMSKYGLKFVYTSNIYTATLQAYIMHVNGGVNLSGYRSRWTDSQTSYASPSLLSTWYNFGTWTTAGSVGFDQIQLNRSIAYDVDGSGGFGDGSNTDSASPGLTRIYVGTPINISTGSTVAMQHQYQTTAECSDWFMDATSTYSITLKKSGYYDHTSTSFKHVARHWHDQSGMC